MTSYKTRCAGLISIVTRSQKPARCFCSRVGRPGVYSSLETRRQCFSWLVEDRQNRSGSTPLFHRHSRVTICRQARCIRPRESMGRCIQLLGNLATEAKDGAAGGLLRISRHNRVHQSAQFLARQTNWTYLSLALTAKSGQLPGRQAMAVTDSEGGGRSVT
jgi:hypothetical protein